MNSSRSTCGLPSSGGRVLIMPITSTRVPWFRGCIMLPFPWGVHHWFYEDPRILLVVVLTTMRSNTWSCLPPREISSSFHHGSNTVCQWFLRKNQQPTKATFHESRLPLMLRAPLRRSETKTTTYGITQPGRTILRSDSYEREPLLFE